MRISCSSKTVDKLHRQLDYVRVLADLLLAASALAALSRCRRSSLDVAPVLSVLGGGGGMFGDSSSDSELELLLSSEESSSA